MALAADLALALDPVALATAAGLELDPWQARALRSTAPRKLFNCSRQSGKSTVVAVEALHVALYEPASLILLVSPSLRQSQELFKDKVLPLYRALDRSEPPGAESALRLELPNRSRIISLPGKEGTIRGYSGVRLLAFDEASRVPNALYSACRPMLAVSRGSLVGLSTPFGTRGWWYEAWRSADAWDRYEVPATACPRIPADFLEEERRTLGDWWYEQEYLCRFLDAETQAFTREEVDSAFREEVAPWVL